MKRLTIPIRGQCLAGVAFALLYCSATRGQALFPEPHRVPLAVSEPVGVSSAKPLPALANMPRLSVENQQPTHAQRRTQLFKRAEETLTPAARQREAMRAVAEAAGIPLEVPRDREGRVNPLFDVTEAGEPLYLTPRDVAAADTISADNLWPSGTAPWPVGQSGFGLTGSGQVVGLWDIDGGVRTSHSQLISRVTQGDSPAATSAHATWVAGMLGSAGATANVNIGGTLFDIGQYSRGPAYEADIIAYDFSNFLTELDFEAANDLKLSVHGYGIAAGWNHDGTDWIWYGTADQEHWLFGAYLNSVQGGSRQLDDFAYDAPHSLLVYSASNARNVGPGGPVTYYLATDVSKSSPQTATKDWNNGDASGYDSLTPLESAKNVLSVGGVYDLEGGYSTPAAVTAASFSGWGPTDDGRIKPDLVAPAIRSGSISSPWNPFGWTGFVGPDSASDFSYVAGLIGNSFSAPDVAGSLGLLLEQREADRPEWIGNNYPIQSSTLRALAIHTADEAGPADGPDYAFGYGLFNAETAATLMHSDVTSGSNPAYNGPKPFVKEVLLSATDFIEFNINAVSSSTPLKVTICWTDPEGPGQTSGTIDQTTARLVNDLDLRITTPASSVLEPWILDPDLAGKSAAIRDDPAGNGDDSLNNVEQIVIENPSTSGSYVVRVTHKGASLSGGQQWVSIIISGNTIPAVNLAITNIFNAMNGQYVITYNTVVGGVYRLEGAPTVFGPWADATGDIVAVRESTSTLVTAPGGSTSYFWRVARYY